MQKKSHKILSVLTSVLTIVSLTVNFGLLGVLQAWADETQNQELRILQSDIIEGGGNDSVSFSDKDIHLNGVDSIDYLNSLEEINLINYLIKFFDLKSYWGKTIRIPFSSLNPDGVPGGDSDYLLVTMPNPSFDKGTQKTVWTEFFYSYFVSGKKIEKPDLIRMIFQKETDLSLGNRVDFLRKAKNFFDSKAMTHQNQGEILPKKQSQGLLDFFLNQVKAADSGIFSNEDNLNDNNNGVEPLEVFDLKDPKVQQLLMILLLGFIQNKMGEVNNLPKQDCLKQGGEWDGNTQSCVFPTPEEMDCPEGSVDFSLNSHIGDGECHELSELRQNCEQNGGRWYRLGRGAGPNGDQVSKFCKTSQNMFYVVNGLGDYERNSVSLWEILLPKQAQALSQSLPFTYSCRCPENYCGDPQGRCIIEDESLKDKDGDGVPNGTDKCPKTAEGEEVNDEDGSPDQGCSCADLKKKGKLKKKSCPPSGCRGPYWVEFPVITEDDLCSGGIMQDIGEICTPTQSISQQCSPPQQPNSNQNSSQQQQPQQSPQGGQQGGGQQGGGGGGSGSGGGGGGGGQQQGSQQPGSQQPGNTKPPPGSTETPTGLNTSGIPSGIPSIDPNSPNYGVPGSAISTDLETGKNFINQDLRMAGPGGGTMYIPRGAEFVGKDGIIARVYDPTGVHSANLRAEGNPISYAQGKGYETVSRADGSVTQYFNDGSSITLRTNGNASFTTTNNGQIDTVDLPRSISGATGNYGQVWNFNTGSPNVVAQRSYTDPITGGKMTEKVEIAQAKGDVSNTTMDYTKVTQTLTDPNGKVLATVSGSNNTVPQDQLGRSIFERYLDSIKNIEAQNALVEEAMKESHPLRGPNENQYGGGPEGRGNYSESYQYEGGPEGMGNYSDGKTAGDSCYGSSSGSISEVGDFVLPPEACNGQPMTTKQEAAGPENDKTEGGGKPAPETEKSESGSSSGGGSGGK